MKYRYVITCEGVVEADTEAQARTAALWELDNGLQALTTVQLESLARSAERLRALEERFDVFHPLTKGEGEA